MLVSVIIPVYNSEKYLRECIQSALAQEFDDFEVLLINDGSTDGSGVICDEYAFQDQRVRVFHKENEGVSSARNVGLEHAAGEWITFIDSDDTIEPNYFSALDESDGTALIMHGFNYYKVSDLVKKIKYSTQILSIAELLERYQLYPHFSSTWAKFFKTALIRKFKISFCEHLTFGEDSLFTLKYLLHCEKIKTADSLGYNYRLSDTGLTHTKLNLEHDKLFYDNIQEALLALGNKKFYKEALETVLARLLTSLYSDRSVLPLRRRKILKEKIEQYPTLIFSIYTNPKIRIFITLAQLTGNYFLLDAILSRLSKKSA